MNQVGGSKTDTLVKLVLVFFISLLSFSIGTFVGKKYSDNQHKLAALEPEGGHREVASEHGEESKAMSDDEISKLAEEFAEDGAETAAHGTAHGEANEHGEAAGHDDGHGATAKTDAKDAHGAKPDAHAAKATVAKTDAHGAHGEKADAHAMPVAATKAPAKLTAHDGPAEPSAAARNVASGHPPIESIAKKAQQESRIPTNLPKDVAQYSVGKFTVQIASYGFEEEAKKRATELKDKGYGAFYVPAQVNGKTRYRVNVGLFATQKEAQDYKSKFAAEMKSPDSLVQKISN